MNYDQNYYDKVYGNYLKQSDYHIKLSKFYMYNIFECNGYQLEGKKILDYGSGPGHLTLSVKADCYDISEYIRQHLKSVGRIVFSKPDEIVDATYDYIYNSHSLEHCSNPSEELGVFYHKLKGNGRLALILPIEKIPGNFVYSQDIHKHLYCWNFQTITNLLIENGFIPEKQKVIYGPTGLTYFSNLTIVKTLGRLKKNFPSMLIIAKKRN